jgi:16S rRNA (guanine966-N2)-methyltransferase
MRIIGGKNRGRKLLLPDESLVRPTPDRVREAIFNILAHHPEVNLTGARVLDAFAGSGAMGLEALSRGAESVTFVEIHARVIPVLEQNINHLADPGQTTLIRGDLLTLKTAPQPMDLVFLDPPYGKGLESEGLPQLINQGWIDQNTLLVYETAAKTDTAFFGDWVDLLDERSYGPIKIRLLRKRPPLLP